MKRGQEVLGVLEVLEVSRGGFRFHRISDRVIIIDIFLEYSILSHE